MASFWEEFIQKKLKDPHFLVKSLIVLSFTLLMALILPKSYRLTYQYEIGRPWGSATLKAPFDFAIYKRPDSLRQEQEYQRSLVSPIYLRDSLNEKSSVQKLESRLDEFYQVLTAYQTAKEGGVEAQINSLSNSLSNTFHISPELAPRLLEEKAKTNLYQQVQAEAKEIYTEGYVANPIDTGLTIINLRQSLAQEIQVPVPRMLYPDRIQTWLEARELKGDTKALVSALLSENLLPNYAYSESLTEKERDRVADLVSPVYGKISQRSTIIEKGQVVDKRTDAILRSLIIEKERRYGSESYLGRYASSIIITLLITAVFLAYLQVNQHTIYLNNRKLCLSLFIFLFAVGSMALATRLTDLFLRINVSPDLNLNYIYLAPACIVPIFISNFFGFRVGFISNILTALYGSVLLHQGLDFIFIQIIAGSVTVYRLRSIHKREIFIYTLGYTFVAYCMAYVMFNLYSQGSFQEIDYGNLILFAANIILTMVAYSLVYLVEKIFRVTSDLTYLELLDTQHPVLLKLAREAPGSFHHSLEVANIAEAAASEIGGNGLIAHVGALYHDIGKLSDPLYFIENQDDYNPHLALSAKESAAKIIGHVQHGIELANKFGLPQEIIDFIETHHGTTKVEYFYRQYCKDNPEEIDTCKDMFRYSGPLPSTKEMAVLMLADSVEAASRTLKKPTPIDIENLVNGIIEAKIKSKQLIKSNLTFSDIETIRQVFIKQIMSIYHNRISYPEPVSESA